MYGTSFWNAPLDSILTSALAAGGWCILAAGLNATTFWRRLLLGTLWFGLTHAWLWGLYPMHWLGLSNQQSLGVVLLAVLWILGHGLLLWLAGLWLSKKLSKYFREHTRWLLIPLWALGTEGLLWAFSFNGGLLPWALPTYLQASHGTGCWLLAHIGTHGLWWLMVAVNIGLSIWSKNAARRLLILWLTLWALIGMSQQPVVLHDSVLLNRQRWQPVGGNIGIEAITNWENQIATKNSNQSEPTGPYLRQIQQRAALVGNTYYVFPEGGVLHGWWQASKPQKILTGQASLQQWLKRQNSQALVVASSVVASSVVTSSVVTSSVIPGQHYNSLFWLNPNRKNHVLVPVYHKRLLVPFGEQWPFEPLWPWPFSGLYRYVYQPGPSQQPTVTLGTTTIKPLLCFELAYAPFLERSKSKIDLQKTDLWIVSSNLGWFHGQLNTSTALMAKAWMLEQHIPVLLASDSGPTGILLWAQDTIPRHSNDTGRKPFISVP